MALTIPVAEIVENSRNPLLGKHESWGRVLLGDIATIQNGYPFKSAQFTRNEGVPLIRIRDVGADNSETFYVGDYDPAFVVQAGDLLVGMDGDFNCARWRGVNGLLNQRVCRVIPKSDVYHPKLLDYVLPGYLKAINDLTSSVTVKHLSSKTIAEIPLPLPPMDQQEQIVAEIEKQFSRLDEAVANLKRVKANLKRYKAAVLKAAVEGRLVETEAELARRESRSYETGEQLLQRILETRRKEWKGKGKYKEPATPDTADLPELPEGWVWVSLDSLIANGPQNGLYLPKSLYGSGHPILRIDDYQQDWMRPVAELQRVRAAVEDVATYSLRGGDLVINRVNSPSHLGKVAIWTVSAEQPIFESNMMRATLSPAVVPHFIAMYLRSADGRVRLTKQAKWAVNQASINQQDVCGTSVPLPPHSEQLRIVAEVDRRISLVREVDAQVDANLKRAERLRQSILSDAFSGALPNLATSALKAAA